MSKIQALYKMILIQCIFISRLIKFPYLKPILLQDCFYKFALVLDKNSKTSLPHFPQFKVRFPLFPQFILLLLLLLDFTNQTYLVSSKSRQLTTPLNSLDH